MPARGDGQAVTQSADTGEQTLARDRLGAGPRGNEGKVALPERLTQPIGEIEHLRGLLAQHADIVGGQLPAVLKRRGVAPEQARELQDLRARARLELRSRGRPSTLRIGTPQQPRDVLQGLLAGGLDFGCLPAPRVRDRLRQVS
jgi:hypothetical protein